MPADPIRRTLVVGASGGIGAALVTALREHDSGAQIFAASRSGAHVAGAEALQLDSTNEDSIAAAAAAIGAPLDAVIVATGTLHSANYQPEKSWRELNGAALGDVFAINAIGPALVAKHFLPLLAKDQRAVFAALSARVGSISDNRLGGWYAYRASKAALNMLLKSLAIELARRNRNGIVLGLHPGTVDTQLSAPFQRGVPEGKLFTPAYSAARLLTLIHRATPEHSGQCLAWDGQLIEP